MNHKLFRIFAAHMAETLKEKTAKGLFWGALNNGATQVLNLVFGIFLARLLSTEDYGIVALISIFTLLAGCIQSAGFAQALANQPGQQMELHGQFVNHKHHGSGGIAGAGQCERRGRPTGTGIPQDAPFHIVPLISSHVRIGAGGLRVHLVHHWTEVGRECRAASDSLHQWCLHPPALTLPQCHHQ